MTGPVVLALALLTARGQAVESVGGGTRLDCCPPASGHSVTGRGLRTSPSCVAFALALGEDRSRSSDRYRETAFDVPGRGLLTATGRADSVRVPLLAGEVAVTVRGHAIPLVALVTTRGHRCGHPPPQERVETFAVSQAPAVSEVPAAVVPPVGGATMAALPSAVKDLARFFLNLTGSSSLGAVGRRGCSCIGSGGSAVPSGSWWRSSRTLCCDCDSCWCGGSSCCSRCCARLVRSSAASGDLPP